MGNLAEQARRLNRGMTAGFALLTDPQRLRDPLPLLPLLPPGSLVVLRHYDAPGRSALARRVLRACRARRLVLLIADDLDLAVSLHTGLHLPEWRARAAGARVRLWHRNTKETMSVAAHSRLVLVRAARLSADLALLSPVFVTASHAGARTLGARRFRSMARKAHVPVWALGGVTAKTLRALRNSSAAGIGTVGNLTRG